jgi:predicted ATP-grasp superfamily ATP-dependent carboligase
VARPEDHSAVLLTLSATGLAVARSLGSHGVTAYGVDQTGTEIGHFSRYVKHDKRIHRCGPGTDLLEGLLAFGADAAERPVLYTCGDPYMEFVCTHHELLRERFILPESMRPDMAGALVDKKPFYRRCLDLDVAMPRTYFPDSEDLAAHAANELRYPAIVKPTQGHLFRQRLGGEKLVEVSSAAELLDWWRRFREWGGDSVLQEVIPGPESNIFVAALYVDRAGEIRSLFTARKSRQYPPRFGSGSYMEACWAPEIADLSEELVRGLSYTGVCGTEYKWDARDEEWKLIELNPRPTLWFSLPPAAGVDVVWDAHCDLTGHPNPPHLGGQNDRVRWQLPIRDLLSGLHFYRAGELSGLEFLRTVVDPRRKRFGDVSLDDPGTALGTCVDVVAKYFTHVRSRDGP